MEGTLTVSKSSWSSQRASYFVDEIAKYVKLDVLKPALVEEGFIEDEDLYTDDLGPAFREHSRRKDRAKFLADCVFDGPSFKRDAFRRAVKKNACMDGHGDLGHDYILALLDGSVSEFADEAFIRQSRELNRNIKSHMQDMIEYTDMASLCHLMVEKRLLTFAEFEKFRDDKRTHSRRELNGRMFALLTTKGPTAHAIFVQCLSSTREQCEEHRQLLELVVTDTSQVDALDFSSPCRSLYKLQLPHCVTGRHYHERRHRFEACYHNGDWQGLLRESKKCLESGNPDTIIIGYLELALGCIFRLDEFEVNKNLRLANDVITTRSKHRNIFYAWSKYLQSLLLRYQGKYEEASSLAETAVMVLEPYEVGEGKAFAQYCYATSFVETLRPDCTEEDFRKAEELLIVSINYANEAADMEILVIYSQLQLARLYLGTTQTSLTVTSDQSRIERSGSCLSTLKTKLDRNELNTRFICLYHLRRSDHHRSRGEFRLAKLTAEEAMKLAVDANLPIERKEAEGRVAYINNEI